MSRLGLKMAVGGALALALSVSSVFAATCPELLIGGVAYNCSNKGAWSATATYRGCYIHAIGDTVELGTYGPENKKLLWWSKFYTNNSEDGNKPGEFAPGGGTSPFVLINSNGVSKGTGVGQWVGWNADQDTKLAAGSAVVPTWRDGAEGAYTIIHDDIGSMGWAACIQPGWDIELKYPKVHVAWGDVNSFTAEAGGDDYEAKEWVNMSKMITQGAEIISHSWNHHSAADQWLWYSPNDTLPVTEPSLPSMLRGLVVEPLWASTNTETWQKGTKTWSNSLVSITGPSNFSGIDPSSDVGDAGSFVVTPASGVETIILPGTNFKVYVKYTKKDTIDFKNEGKIAAVDPQWFEPSVLAEKFPDKNGPDQIADQGRTGFTFKVWVLKGWDAADQVLNTATAKLQIDTILYDKIRNYCGFGPHFAPNKSLEYFIYPYDAYSEKTHDMLYAGGIAAGRGGAKSGKPLPPDFFHPFRIDFDAFYIANGDTSDVIKKGDGATNKHQILSLSGMVNDIIASHGYMIRETHAVCKVTDWNQINETSTGGWWGGIPENLYDAHLAWLTELIDANKLAVLTPSEAVKYRMTANAVTGATLAGDILTVTPTGVVDDRYKDEISVIVKLSAPAAKLAVEYTGGDQALAGATWSKYPRIAPRKLDANGQAWAVSMNPFLGSVKLTPDADFLGGTFTGDTSIAALENLINGTGVAIQNNAAKGAVKGQLIGIVNSKLLVRLPAGEYTAEIISPTGRLMHRAQFSAAAAGVVDTKLAVHNLPAGFYVLNVKSAAGVVMTQKFLSD